MITTQRRQLTNLDRAATQGYGAMSRTNDPVTVVWSEPAPPAVDPPKDPGPPTTSPPAGLDETDAVALWAREAV